MNLKLTDAAIEAIKKSFADNHIDLSSAWLRVFITGGGCSGYIYNMEPTLELKPTDTELSFGEVRIAIDQMSGLLLNGTEIDYQSNFQSSGFVFKNPNAKRTCGCSKSFS